MLLCPTQAPVLAHPHHLYTVDVDPRVVSNLHHLCNSAPLLPLLTLLFHSHPTPIHPLYTWFLSRSWFLSSSLTAPALESKSNYHFKSAHRHSAGVPVFWKAGDLAHAPRPTILKGACPSYICVTGASLNLLDGEYQLARSTTATTINDVGTDAAVAAASAVHTETVYFKKGKVHVHS